MKPTRDNNDPLISPLEDRLRAYDEEIAILQSKRAAIAATLEALYGNTTESKTKLMKKPRPKPKGSTRSEIFDVLSELVSEYQRPVGLDEIMQALSDKGIKIGKNDAKRRSYLGAVFSYELKKENPKIIRLERGTYDIKK